MIASQQEIRKTTSDERIKKNEELLAQVQEIVHAGIYECDLATNKRIFSSELVKLYGFSPDVHFDQDNFEGSVHPDDIGLLRNAFDSTITNDKPLNIEYRIFLPDGNIRFLWLKGKVFKSEHNNARLIGTVFDITDRKWAEEEMNNKNIAVLNAYKKLERSKEELKSLNNNLEIIIEERTRELRKSENEFRYLVETIPHMVWRAEANGDHDFFNQNWHDYTGLTFKESKNKKWLVVVHPDDYSKTIQYWEHCLETASEFTLEYRLRKYDGTYRWFLSKAMPIFDDNGHVSKWFGTCTDIDDHKKLNDKKDEFIGIASHELKTPLTSIKAYVQLLERHFKDKGEDSSLLYLTKTNTYINRLNELIADLLDVSKITAGKLHFNMDYFNFNDLVNESIESLQYITTSHKIIRHGKADIMVYGDKQRLEQVFINFISNAIKYSPDSKHVDVYINAFNDHVSVKVKDYGIGIKKQNLSSLFTRFYRVEGLSPKFTGLGIGLYISSEIVKRHGGEVNVSSEEGKGSEFTFTIPVKHQEVISS